ncbi:MAG: glycerol-3-phosphate 1-O-acyltransferase PlsY [Pseudomonadota bacterium]
MDLLTTAALAGFAIAAYLFGSIPFGLLVTKAMGLTDPREIGSGNIGATNVLRTGSKIAGAATLLLDALKGLVAVFVGGWLFGEGGGELGGLAAFLGHLFPIWLWFKGGKGVATFLGVVIGLSLPLGIAACVTWLVAARATRMSSAGALVASLAVPIFGFFFLPSTLPLLMLLTVLIWIRHGANIRRILAGREPKIGEKSP